MCQNTDGTYRKLLGNRRFPYVLKYTQNCRTIDALQPLNSMHGSETPAQQGAAKLGSFADIVWCRLSLFSTHRKSQLASLQRVLSNIVIGWKFSQRACFSNKWKRAFTVPLACAANKKYLTTHITGLKWFTNL